MGEYRFSVEIKADSDGSEVVLPENAYAELSLPLPETMRRLSDRVELYGLDGGEKTKLSCEPTEGPDGKTKLFFRLSAADSYSEYMFYVNADAETTVSETLPPETLPPETSVPETQPAEESVSEPPRITVTTVRAPEPVPETTQDMPASVTYGAAGNERDSGTAESHTGASGTADNRADESLAADAGALNPHTAGEAALMIPAAAGISVFLVRQRARKRHRT